MSDNWRSSLKRSSKLFRLHIGLLLAGLMLFLVACQTGEEPATNGSDEAESEQTDDETVDLVMWIHSAEPFIAAHEEIIELYEAENPNVNIELQSFPFAEFGTKVAAEIPAGGGPDIMEAYGPWMSIYMRTGRLAAVPDSFLSPEGMRETYYESTLTSLEHEGQYYGVPSNVAAGSTRVLLVNNNAVESAGVDFDDNEAFDDWINDWQSLTETDDAGNITQSGLGMYCGQTADLFVSYLLALGGSVTDEAGRQAAFNSEAGVTALQLMEDYVEEYEIDTVNITDFSCVAQGTAATSYRGTWVIPVFEGEFPDFEWHYELLPLPPGSTEEVWQGGAGWATFVPASSDKQEAAWEFVEFLEENREAWIQNTAEIPADKELAATVAEENPELYSVYYPILEQSVHGYPYGDYFQIQSMFQDMVNLVLLDEATVEEALAQTEEMFNAHLDQWWQQFDE